MLGAIVGDIIGVPFERQNYDGTRNHKSKEFDLFTDKGAISTFSDDTICTCAIAKSLMSRATAPDTHTMKELFAHWMWELGRKFIDRGFGGQFTEWLKDDDGPPPPFGSWGNGSAMRVSPIGWLPGPLSHILHTAGHSAAVTHNHPDAIKGAKAVAHAIWLCRQSNAREMVKAVLTVEYYPELREMTLDEIRPTYQFTTKCSETVPVALIAFLESTDFEDAIRNAISVGGDSDTLAAITGSIAHAFYGEVPEVILKEALWRLPPTLSQIVEEWCEVFGKEDMGDKNPKAFRLP